MNKTINILCRKTIGRIFTAASFKVSFTLEHIPQWACFDAEIGIILSLRHNATVHYGICRPQHLVWIRLETHTKSNSDADFANFILARVNSKHFRISAFSAFILHLFFYLPTYLPPTTHLPTYLPRYGCPTVISQLGAWSISVEEGLHVNQI